MTKQTKPSTQSEKKSYQQKLVEFMQAKQDVFVEIGIKSPKYFNAADKKFLLKLKDKDAKFVVHELKEVINYRNASGVGMNVCPFCVLQRKSCTYCVYKKNHGGFQCGSALSSFDKIDEKYISREHKYKDALSNNHYKQIMNKIERGK